jgi:hypothetical protein
LYGGKEFAIPSTCGEDVAHAISFEPFSPSPHANARNPHKMGEITDMAMAEMTEPTALMDAPPAPRPAPARAARRPHHRGGAGSI